MPILGCASDTAAERAGIKRYWPFFLGDDMTVRVSEDEYAALKVIAAAKGTNVAALVRGEVLSTRQEG